MAAKPLPHTPVKWSICKSTWAYKMPKSCGNGLSMRSIWLKTKSTNTKLTVIGNAAMHPLPSAIKNGTSYKPTVNTCAKLTAMKAIRFGTDPNSNNTWKVTATLAAYTTPTPAMFIRWITAWAWLPLPPHMAHNCLNNRLWATFSPKQANGASPPHKAKCSPKTWCWPVTCLPACWNNLPTCKPWPIKSCQLAHMWLPPSLWANVPTTPSTTIWPCATPILCSITTV